MGRAQQIKKYKEKAQLPPRFLALCATTKYRLFFTRIIYNRVIEKEK